MPSPRLSIVDVFNRYRFPGGEEYSVERIRRHLEQHHQITECNYNSMEWQRPGAPRTMNQALRLFYNPEGRERFEAVVDSANADLAVFHNIYPIGSPALYRSAQQRRLPVMQFLHNYRPFAVGGTLYSKGRILPDPLYGQYWQEIREGAWMGSVPRSMLMAVLLKLLHHSGWLNSVRMWITISDFMRYRLINAGAVRADRVVTLRHCWKAMPEPPRHQDAGFYLFLGRFVAEKGIATLLDAWDLLHHQLGRNTPSLHLGGEGPLADTIITRARSNPYICHLGTVGGQSKIDELNQCRAVVVPSVWWEPLGLVTYEAYDHAKPVLAAKSGGLTETVVPGVTGLVHEPGDASALAADVLAIEQMSQDERAGLGAAGREWLRREADPTAWLRQFTEIAQRAIAS